MANTPGPWEVVSKAGYPAVYGGERVICSPGGFSIKELRESPAKAAQIVADAHLISAAPDLAEGLSWALDLLDMYDRRMVEMGESEADIYAPIHLKAKAKARAALAKARGAQ